MNIERIRIDLLERLEALEARSDKASRHASHRDEPLSADFEEQATESANDEVLSVIADEALHEADHIRDALKRIALGHYGICDQCGDQITEARLIAVPYSTRCIECA